MSTTTTANPRTYQLRTVLADYDLHHSAETPELDTSLNAHPVPGSHVTSQNPPDWPTDERRVPPCRPVNTNLDQSQRRVYTSPVERAFVTVMFTGVYLEAVSMQRILNSDETNFSIDGKLGLENYYGSCVECGLQGRWRVVIDKHYLFAISQT